MIKILLLIAIVGIAFWMGRQSVTAKKIKRPDRDEQKKSPVIDIEIEK